MAADEGELRKLMLAGLDGDGGAYQELLGQLSAHLRAYYKRKLARVGRSVTEAEDLVQDTLMAVHTRRHTFDRGAPLTPWVYAIARYKLIDHLRHTRLSASDVPIEEAEEIFADSDQVGAESALDLHRLLAGLPEKMRLAIQSVKIDGLSVAEAGARYGMSQSAIKVSIHRGLKALAASVSRGKA